MTATAKEESSEALTQWLIERALAEGFDSAGIASPEGIGEAGSRFEAFINDGFHGEMSWLAEKADRRVHPRALWPEVRSILMLGLNYGPLSNPLDALMHKSNAAVSVYAKGGDYHDVIKKKLKAIVRDFVSRYGAQVKVFVDTAPVMEKPLAQAAGIGWQGKHTNLLSRDRGSWLFLGAIFTDALLKPSSPETDHCGGCRRCLDICPTDAFPAPYRLDARRCISYLTIELKSQIPLEFRRAIGNRVYGCDDCLAVCPWNKFAQQSSEMKFAVTEGSDNPPLIDLLRLDDAGFRRQFRGSPIKRSGRDRFVRNVLVAAGNSGDGALIPAILPLLRDGSAAVRGMAVWALTQLAAGDGLSKMRDRHLGEEVEPSVRAEWESVR